MKDKKRVGQRQRFSETVTAGNSEENATGLIARRPGRALGSAARLKSIDFLRGSAALAVVVHHAINYGRDVSAQSGWLRGVHLILTQGHLGVPLFFVISGFCIHLQWVRRYVESGQQATDFTGFWKRRLYRLYPPYVIALCLSMGLVVAAYMGGWNVPLVALYPEPRATWIAVDFVAHLAMLHGLHPVLDKAGGNPPFWTLAREEYFYLLYFVLLLWRRKVGLRQSFLIVLGVGFLFPAVMSVVLPSESAWWMVVNSSALVLWVQWSLGMVAVEAYYGLIRLPRWCSRWGLIPVWAALAYTADWCAGWAAPFLWGMTFFTLLNCCVRCECAGAWPVGRVVRWLGSAGVFSYSLYLVHNPVRGIVKRLLGAWADAPYPLAYLSVTALLIVGGYLAGKGYFLLVERHFINSPRRRLWAVPREVLPCEKTNAA